jgi:hypothetical protein
MICSIQRIIDFARMVSTVLYPPVVRTEDILTVVVILEV